MNEIQAQGSIITYLRRYSLSSILGIVTDADADGYAQRESKKDLEANLKAEIQKCSNVEQLKSIYSENENEFASNSNLMNELTQRKTALNKLFKEKK
jgi:spore germination cell wall hydrolase CwlJ-like protein